MADSVKNIFRLLVKVPIIIAVSYLIINIFAFTVSYFRLLGYSYIVMQTAMENNFLPATELQTLRDYGNSLETPLLDNVQITIVTGYSSGTPTPGTLSNDKKQYGTPVYVDVCGTYTWMLPDFRNGATVNDMSGDSIEYFRDGSVPASTSTISDSDYYTGSDGSRTKFALLNNMIRISYVVPGLKYYPDLDTDTYNS